ncbi:hypothetical protein [Gaopeijia maritima]|uniref:hypothetical protein n=1 Tax=Gaopeijia maritima TaxID=3119007 RepID=UPI003283D600
MKSTHLASLAGALMLVPAALAAQNPHVGHVATGFANTPDNMGLLPVAVAEAETAAQHAGLAARDLSNLDAMKTHIGHVQHAVDPSVVEAGPGMGYGVKQAATGVAQHIELAAGTDGVEAAVTTHAPHIAQSANNTVTRADRIMQLAAMVQDAESADAAAPMVEEIAQLATQLMEGVDADGDGRVGWQEGEGGLATAQQHLGFVMGG